MLYKLCETKTVFDDQTAMSGCSDLLMHPNGKTLDSTSNPRTISVMDIHEDGTLTLKQNQDCGGDYPRTICLSPEGRFRLSGNNPSGTITVFRVHEDGTLEETGKTFAGVSPSVIRFFTAKEC